VAASRNRERTEALLVVAVTGCFAVYLCQGIGSVLQGSDYLLMWKPIWYFLRHALLGGTIPLWNPYIDLGRPFLADVQNAIFYPPVYLVLLGQPMGVIALIWLHLGIAVFGMRRLGEVLGATRGASYFMGLCFVGSGALTSRWVNGQIPYCWGLCYVPWLFHFAAQTNRPWSWRRVAGHALALALQFLCGNPQVFWFSAIGQGIFIFGQSVKLPIREAMVDLRRGWLQLGVAMVWCVGLVSAELLPFMELVKEGNRNAPSRAYASFMKLEWMNFGSLFSPIGISNRYAGQYWEMNLFVGVIVVVLGICGLRRIRESAVRGLLAMLAVSVLLAVGNSTPAFEIFYRWLPGFASLRIHAREGFLISFALICAAGISLSRPHPRLLAWWKHNGSTPVHYLFAALVLLQTLDLWRATMKIKGTYTFGVTMHYSPDFAYQRPLVEQLQAAGLIEPFQPPPRVCLPANFAPANNGMMYRYSNLDGNFSLFLQRDWDFLHRSLGLKPSQFLNTGISTQVYDHGPFPYPDLAISAGYDPATEKIVVTTNPSPRAFLVYSAEVVSNYDTIMAQLAGGHNIHESALLEKSLPNPLPQHSNQTAATAHIRRFELNSLLVDVDAKADALLVLAEAWYPGWRAEIDGRVCDCVPANIWMRAVPVPAGRHEVRVYFHQDYLLPGLVISGISLGLLLVVVSIPLSKKSAKL
jgi:hypothetical protein